METRSVTIPLKEFEELQDKIRFYREQASQTRDEVFLEFKGQFEDRGRVIDELNLDKFKLKEDIINLKKDRDKFESQYSVSLEILCLIIVALGAFLIYR